MYVREREREKEICLCVCVREKKREWGGEKERVQHRQTQKSLSLSCFIVSWLFGILPISLSVFVCHLSPCVWVNFCVCVCMRERERRMHVCSSVNGSGVHKLQLLRWPFFIHIFSLSLTHTHTHTHTHVSPPWACNQVFGGLMFCWIKHAHNVLELLSTKIYNFLSNYLLLIVLW